MPPRLKRPTDDEIEMMVEKLSIYRTHECKSKTCELIHQRMIDTLEWVMGRRLRP